MAPSFREKEKTGSPGSEAAVDETHATQPVQRFRQRKRKAKGTNAFDRKHRFWPALLVLGSGFGVLLCTSIVGTIFNGSTSPLLPLAGAILTVFGGIWVARLVRHRHAAQTARHQALSMRLESLEDQAWEIRESEELHRTLTEGFGDVVLHRDDDGTVNFTNSIFPLYFDADHPAPSPGTKGELRLQTRQGERWFSWTESKVRNSETGRNGMQAVGRDITERRLGEDERQQALEMAREAGFARARFLATMSHEMRTPLNGILGMNRLLSETSLSATQREYSRAIGESGQVLLSLIDDVLDTALVDEGKITLEPQDVVLLPLVESVGELLAARQREAAMPVNSDQQAMESLPVGIHVDAACPKTIRVDEKRFRQVLMNLVGNALKFTQSGGVGLFVERVESGLRFTVRDSGPGMDEAEQERLFEPFEQGQQGVTRRHGGAGLGLSIARHLVSLMGGELTVESAAGSGCAFSFTLPVQALTKHKPDTMEREPVALVMERSPARNALVKSITQQGHACHCFTGTEVFAAACEAVQWPPVVEGSNPDRVTQAGFIIVSHNHMKEDGKGVQTLRQRLNAIGLSAMKYISLTAASRRQVGMELPLASADRQAVFDGWLTWPVRQNSLKRVLRKSLAASSHRATITPPPMALEIEKSGETQRVLLAEDNSINALLARSLLTKMGYDVTTVANGAEALKAVDSNDFDLILLDLHMPVMDGMDALKTLRKREKYKGLVPAPIYILSADNQPAIRQEAIANGATDFLLKPLDFDAVRASLENHGAMKSKGGQSA